MSSRSLISLVGLLVLVAGLVLSGPDIIRSVKMKMM